MRGGARPGSGRKKRMQEEELIDKLSPYEDLFFEALEAKLKEKDTKIMDLYAKYYFGEQVKKIESKIEGSISGLTVEVINSLTNDKPENSDKQGL